MTTPYQLISFTTCPWVQRAAIVLREKGVAFDFQHIEAGNRPDWFAAISPHGKVPVLRIDERTVLFESNAIAEYLDEAVGEPLHPADLVRRAINRAWTDYLPTFAAALTAVSGAADGEPRAKAVAALGQAFTRLEDALAGNGDGPWFNGADYALVDAGYAPFLQRWLIVERLTGKELIAAYPRLARWARALVERPSTHSFPPEEFDALYRTILVKRDGWIAALLSEPT